MSSDTTETKRDRVRRLVITPLQEAGFRFRRGAGAERVQGQLDRMADALCYMNDRGLEAVRASLLTKGEGAARCFWPGFATVIALAEAFQPRPLEAVPEVLSWFRSRAGEQALVGDRLVAEFKFWERKKRPPIYDQDKRLVAERAAEWASKAARIRERRDAGLAILNDDRQWLDWYDDLHRKVAGIVAEGQGARSKDAA